ncbi:Ser/Thr phosphatase family protein [uncultured Eubacteriales bacterium]|uniref:Ser/Thr phosphatase family protein n=1 Tax=uncultured Eubacteriales bacterium TaxID=172733 RepID=A0A212KJF2_9FIRM|nr:Ser/Thr phosphatase family protein [uncultured Eubacteriales bacterium]
MGNYTGPKRRRPLRAVLVALALLLAAGWFFFDQQNRIQTEVFTLSSSTLPAAFDGFRVVQISDLHGKEFGPENETLLRKVAEQSPDLIAITGDLVDDAAQFSMIEPLAKGLAAIAPTYYVTGNHEWAIREAYTVKALLRECGVTVLSNEFFPLERGGETIVLAGIDDPNGPYDQKTPETLGEELRAAYGEAYTLVLAHRNEYHATYSAAGFDLTLAGHAHGGLIRLPFTDGLVDARRQLFPDYTAGWYALEGGGEMVVSRGLGNVGYTFRLFNRPHLPVIVLSAG